MKKFIKDLNPYIICIVVVVLIRSFVFTLGIIDGASMENTLFNNNIVLVNKIGLNFGIDRFDVVSINFNNNYLVKRVIGLPGETVEYIDNILYINGEKVASPIEFEYTKGFKLTAGKNEYIVLGDNRDVSKDSREIGPLDKSTIKGKVEFILYPFKNFGTVK